MSEANAQFAQKQFAQSKEAQEQFVAALLAPDAPTPHGISHPQAGQAAKARFDIYRNNVIYSLHKALCDKFPALAALLGDARFAALADAYIRARQPRLPMLAVYGDELADFMAQSGFCDDVPYAVDVARFEIMRLHAYHAADHVPLAPARLQEQDITTQAVKLAPSLGWLRSDYPLYDIWQFLMGGADAPAPEHSQAQPILIYRDCDLNVQTALLPPFGADYVAHLQAGRSLTDAAQATPALTEAALQDIMILLIHQGLITDAITPLC